MSWRVSGLHLAVAGIAAAVLAPLLVVLSSVWIPTGDIWAHLAANVLPELFRNTLWLVAGVAVGTAVVGVSLAWITAMYDFPARRVFAWALMLPLALPSYVLAFVAVGLLDYTGPVQTELRAWFGHDDFWFPRIRSRGGVIAVMTLAFYPYVYLIVRNAFLTQGLRLFEVAQSLGYSRLRAWWQVALPMARPWIAAGLILVLMETLADFGTVAIFNYDTFTTAIYKTWFGMFSLAAAAQLASILMLVALTLVLIETFSRKRMRYYTPGRARQSRRMRLHGTRAWIASGYCGAVLLIAFVIPLIQIVRWAYAAAARDLDLRYLGFLWHTIALAALAALMVVAFAAVLAAAERRRRDALTRSAVRVATLGYAVPGAVLAVGIVIPLAAADRALAQAFSAVTQTPITSVLAGTLTAMLIAYAVRFMAVGFAPIETAMQRITPTLEEAARGFGVGRAVVWRQVQWPMLRRGLLTAGILVFVDVMKEMPITLMTRPFGWDTMAVRIFEMTSEGEWERAALPALAIVLVALVSIVVLARQQEKDG